MCWSDGWTPGDIGDHRGFPSWDEERRLCWLTLTMASAVSRAAEVMGWLSITSGFAAAIFWCWSALVPIPTAPGASIGGTSPEAPFNVAIAYAGRMNAAAALLTAISVASSAAERVFRLRESKP